MLATQFYFLIYAITKTSPSDLFSFVLIAAMYNCYMIFRDVVFVQWPEFYMIDRSEGAGSHGETLKGATLTFWKRMALFNVIFSLIAFGISVNLVKPTSMHIYNQAIDKLKHRYQVWSKHSLYC